jgi:predicted lipid-binding transport protein (Tim44 family)
MPLSRGAIAGIAVGSVLGFLLILSIVGFYIFSRLRKGRSQASYPTPELQDSPLAGPVGLYSPPLPIDDQASEFAVPEHGVELVNYGSMQVKGIRNIEDMEPIGGAQGRV